MTPMPIRTRSLVLCTSAVLALAACGGSEGEESSTTTSSATSSSSSSTTSSPSPTGDVAPAGLDLTFDTPDSWVVVHPDKVVAGTEKAPKSVTEEAEAAGMTVKEMLKEWGDRLFLVHREDGRMLTIDAVDEMPTKAERTTSMKSREKKTKDGPITYSFEGPTTHETALGTALVSTLKMSTSSSSLFSHEAYVPTDDGAAFFRASSLSEDDDTMSVLEGVLDSVQPAS